MCGVRMGAALLARIEAYGAWLKAEHPGMRVERGDVIRELVHVGLGVVEARTAETSIDPLGGQVLDEVKLVEDQTADHSPINEDQSLSQTAPVQDQHRTTARPGRKRPAAARG
jgi:hypothetical protein